MRFSSFNITKKALSKFDKTRILQYNVAKSKPVRKKGDIKINE